MRSEIKSDMHSHAVGGWKGFDRATSSRRLLYEIVLMIFMVDVKYFNKIYMNILTEMKRNCFAACLRK